MRKRAEFLKLSRFGRKVQSAHFVVISHANQRAQIRLGITVSTKVGNSIVRNRIKRHVREYFRKRRHELPQATDFLIIARPSAAALSGQKLVAELARLLSATPRSNAR